MDFTGGGGSIGSGGGYGGGGFGGGVQRGNPLSSLAAFLRRIGGKRNTEQLGPGSFPGHNPDGSPIEEGPDPYRYANFSMPGQNQPEIGTLPGGGTSSGAGNFPISRFPNLRDILGGGSPGTQTGQTRPGIGSQIWKGLNSDFGQKAFGAGIGLIGAKMQSNQMGKANDIAKLNSDRSYEMAQEEKARRDALIRAIMPMLAQGMQINDPERVRQMVEG